MIKRRMDVEEAADLTYLEWQLLFAEDSPMELEVGEEGDALTAEDAERVVNYESRRSHELPEKPHPSSSQPHLFALKAPNDIGFDYTKKEIAQGKKQGCVLPSEPPPVAESIAHRVKLASRDLERVSDEQREPVHFPCPWSHTPCPDGGTTSVPKYSVEGAEVGPAIVFTERSTQFPIESFEEAVTRRDALEEQVEATREKVAKGRSDGGVKGGVNGGAASPRSNPAPALTSPSPRPHPASLRAHPTRPASHTKPCQGLARRPRPWVAH